MDSIATTLARLRAVRQAGRYFMALHTAECLLDRREAIERLERDLDLELSHAAAETCGSEPDGG